MSEHKRRLQDARRVISPDQIISVVPADILAEGVLDFGRQRHVSFRDYRSKDTEGHIVVPGIDSLVVIIYRNDLTRLRRRLDAGWQDEHISAGNIAIIGGGRPTELEWFSTTNVSHIYVPNKLLVATAASAFERDYNDLEIIDPISFSDKYLLDVGEIIFSELRSPGDGANLFVDSLVSALSVQLIRRCHRDCGTLRAVRGEARLTAAQKIRVLDFIEANISRNFRLLELAALVELSEVHFGRCFMRTFGESPHQFVLKRRIRLAIERISQTKLTFAEIASLTGFADQAHLTRVVKKATGCTPSALRKS
jgi:AraC family transcriptional regulator